MTRRQTHSVVEATRGILGSDVGATRRVHQTTRKQEAEQRCHELNRTADKWTVFWVESDWR